MKSLDVKLDAHGGSCWITEKQVNICRKYMKPVSISPQLYIVIGEWQYTLGIYQKGYGRLTREDKRAAIR